MKQYKVYLSDLDYTTLRNANGELANTGMIHSNLIFYDKVKYEDLDKIRSEISWYLVNENLQERINKALELLEKCLNNYCRNQWEGDWLKLDNPKTGDFYSFEEVFEEIRDILKGINNE